MSKYTDQDHVVNYIKRELTDGEVNLLPAMIKQVSLYIDNYTTRSWKDIDAKEDTAKTDRYFDGSGQKELDVDNFRDLEYIKILDSDGNEFDSYGPSDLSNVIQYPLNNDAKTSVYLISGRFPSYHKCVKINARFDSGDVPEDVIMVATSMVAKLLSKMGDDMRGNVKGKKLGDFSVTYGEVQNIANQMQVEVSMLDQYMSIEL
jgi:hypothetical protein